MLWITAEDTGDFGQQRGLRTGKSPHSKKAIEILLNDQSLYTYSQIAVPQCLSFLEDRDGAGVIQHKPSH